jgi:hypothetical protein
MPKVLTAIGLAVSGLVLLVFLLDLPPLRLTFGGFSLWMDILFIVGAGILGYLSWTAFREQK